MPSTATTFSTSLLITARFCVSILLIDFADAATPQLQRARNFDYTYRFEALSALSNTAEDQRYLRDNLLCGTTSGTQRNQQQQTFTLLNQFQTQENEIDPRFEHWEIDQRIRPCYVEDIYKGLERNCEYKLATKTYHLMPPVNQQFYHPIVGHAAYSPFSKHSNEIIYAPNAPALTQSYRIDSVEQLNPSCLHHKSHSNQQQYAPERQTIAYAQPTHEKLLPYPPSFISITSTTTMATPPQSAPHKSVDYNVNDISQITDIFIKRQHKSLLDSYIPSWVMTRMMQQQKWLQRKQSPRFVFPTHTLAYPIQKRVARKAEFENVNIVGSI